MDSEFLNILSNTTDLNKRSAKLWRNCLSQATVYLTDIPCELDIASDSSSTPPSSYDRGEKAYGLHFGSFSITDSPSSTRDRYSSNKRILYFIIHICCYLFFVCLILSIFNGILYKKFDIFKSFTKAQDPTLPTLVLIVSAITKTLWKTIERRLVALAPLYRRFRTSNESELSASRILGSDYSRMPPAYLTIYAFRDRQYTLVIVSLMSIFIEVANFLLAVAMSMSQGSGWNTGSLFKVSCSAAVFFCILMIFCSLGCNRLYKGFPPFLTRQIPLPINSRTFQGAISFLMTCSHSGLSQIKET